MLDHIIVETSGVKMALSRMAVTSVIDSKTLSVTPYDPNTLKELESATVSSPLGLNPEPDGSRLIAPIPPLFARWWLNFLKMETEHKKSSTEGVQHCHSLLLCRYTR